MRLRLKFLAVTLIFLFAGACGKDDKPANESGASVPAGGTPTTPAISLTGTSWVIEDRATALALYFRDNSRYEIHFVYARSDKRGQVMAKRGNFSLDGNSLKLNASATTCPGFGPVESSSSVKLVSENKLTITSTTGVTAVFRRFDPTLLEVPAGTVVEWGCFDTAGNFKRRGWTNL